MKYKILPESFQFEDTNLAAGDVYTSEVKVDQTVDSPPSRRKRDSKKLFENLTWLTSTEAAEYLRLASVDVLRALVYQRKIPFHKLGRSLRFKKGELDRLLEASRNGGF